MDRYTIHIMYITTYYIILYVFKICIFMYLSKMIRIYMIRWAQICKYGIEDGFLLWWGALLYKATNGTYPYAPCRSIMFHLFRDPEKVQISKKGIIFFRPCWKIINCSNLNVVRAIFWQQRPGQNPSVLSAILEILAMDARIE